MHSRAIALALALTAAGASAQTAARRATNIAALTAFPTFYHGRQVLVLGQVSTDNTGRVHVADGDQSVRVVFKGSAPDGNDEVRGEFWDIGRMNPDDPRLASFDLKGTFGLDADGAWPRPGAITVIIASAVASAQVPTGPSIRAIVLNPTRYANQKVTVTGQFAGRNLLGDLADSPARSRWDFVIRSADAALWISGARPKGKGFDLALDARIDTGRWLQVTGIVNERRGLQWVEITSSDEIQLGKAPAETAPIEEGPAIRVPAAPPPEVVFSAPTHDESDVRLNTSVRIQFSRDINASTIKGRVRVRYLQSESVQRGEPETPTAEFTTQYFGPNRVLEVKFAKPLERFRTLTVELLEGILGTDEQPLKPWTLMFVLGAS